jgi:hypothetical protein
MRYCCNLLLNYHRLYQCNWRSYIVGCFVVLGKFCFRTTIERGRDGNEATWEIDRATIDSSIQCLPTISAPQINSEAVSCSITSCHISATIIWLKCSNRAFNPIFNSYTHCSTVLSCTLWGTWWCSYHHHFPQEPGNQLPPILLHQPLVITMDDGIA